jgi:phospholipid/cholesterol/gamma-HCH transport system substrate-binding protein
METRAPFAVVGAFVLAAIIAVFGFVYWLHNSGGLGPRTTYHVQFDGSVPGLLVGAGVLFNGIRVGEVTELGLAPDNPRRVNATISVAATTPVRSDTRVGLEFQGLTGVPVIAREGGVCHGVDLMPISRPEHDPGRPRRIAQGRFGPD